MAKYTKLNERPDFDSTNSPSNIINTKQFRKRHGLRTVKAGKKKCLRCDNEFNSPDIVLIKICMPCQGINKSIY